MHVELNKTSFDLGLNKCQASARKHESKNYTNLSYSTAATCADWLVTVCTKNIIIVTINSKHTYAQQSS